MRSSGATSGTMRAPVTKASSSAAAIDLGSIIAAASVFLPCVLAVSGMTWCFTASRSGTSATTCGVMASKCE